MSKMQQIAELSGFSLSTVSRVLNNKGEFSDATKRKIQQVVDSLNYTPKSVQDAPSGPSYTIGLFIPEKDAFISDDPALSYDVLNLKEEIEKRGHVILLATNPLDAGQNDTAGRIINEKRIDAAIIVGPYQDDALVRRIIADGIPYLVTNGTDVRKQWNTIDYDNYGGACGVIDALCAQGHRDIAVISGPPSHLVNRNRMDACRDTLSKHGLELPAERMRSGPFSFENGYLSAKSLLLTNPSVSAIFAFNDLIALGAMKAISERGLKIPGDISIIGFDDIEMAKYASPPLTTVRRFKYDIYQIVARMIEDLIENRHIKSIAITLDTELVIRESCKALR